MSSFKIMYYFKYDMFQYYIDQEFQPEDVMPYYDLYDDGSMVLYIKVIKKVRKWFFFDEEVEKIMKIKEKDISVSIIETPERRNCGKE